MRLLDTNTGFGTARCVTPRSARGLAVVVADAVLLARIGSATALAALAVLVRSPGAVGVATIVIVATAPLASVGTAQETIPEA